MSSKARKRVNKACREGRNAGQARHYTPESVAVRTERESRVGRFFSVPFGCLKWGQKSAGWVGR